MCSACNNEELTGSARLIFIANNLETLEVDIYPEGIFTIAELIDTEPILKNLQSNGNGVVVVPNMNAGNYTWYDGGTNIGFFQISAGQTKTYEISIFR